VKYAWFIWSLAFLFIWLVLFILKKDFRKEMFLVSLSTMPLGLTEPLFVPEYWNPPTLFDLAQKTGFDIESLIFCFAIGGVSSILYNLVFGRKFASLCRVEQDSPRHRWHWLILLSPVILFVPLVAFTSLNHIYCGIIAMFFGAIAILICRPDLKIKIWVGGLLFLVLYSIFFFSLMLVLPNYVQHVWNLEKLSGILILDVPIEEFLFAFTFGMLWSSLYEHVAWKKII